MNDYTLFLALLLPFFSSSSLHTYFFHAQNYLWNSNSVVFLWLLHFFSISACFFVSWLSFNHIFALFSEIARQGWANHHTNNLISSLLLRHWKDLCLSTQEFAVIPSHIFFNNSSHWKHQDSVYHRAIIFFFFFLNLKKSSSFWHPFSHYLCF